MSNSEAHSSTAAALIESRPRPNAGSLNALKSCVVDTTIAADDNSLPGTMSPNSARSNRNQSVCSARIFSPFCAYQIGIYCWPSGPPFILDPRAGIPVLLINHFSFDNKVIYPVEWITASWLVIAASMIFFRGKLLRVYLIAEIILAAPTAYYILHPGDPPWRRFRARIQGSSS